MARIHISHLFLLFCLISFSLATVPSFCKCTCFSQSGIIPLNPPSTKPNSESPTDSDSSSSSSSSSNTNSLLTRLLDSTPLRRSLSVLSLNSLTNLTPRSSTRAPTGSSTSASCTKCNRAFCLAQALPFCTDATESDVFTACFQRDSEKDMFIVWGFILATVGLVGWAGVRKVVEMRGMRDEGLVGGGEYERVGGR